MRFCKNERRRSGSSRPSGARKSKRKHRLAANEEEERKRATARAQTEASEARLACLRQVLENNREAAKRRAAAARAKSIARWLQTEYPIDRAETMIAWYTGIRQVDRERYTKEVREMLVTVVLRLPANIPDLWTIDNSFTQQWCQLAPLPPGGGHPRWVRCSAKFYALLEAPRPRPAGPERPPRRALADVSALRPAT